MSATDAETSNSHGCQSLHDIIQIRLPHLCETAASKPLQCSRPITASLRAATSCVIRPPLALHAAHALRHTAPDWHQSAVIGAHLSAPSFTMGSGVPGGQSPLDGRERAVVMRCLIESTARESTDTAVHRALGTIERLRRMHASLPAAGTRP